MPFHAETYNGGAWRSGIARESSASLFEDLDVHVNRCIVCLKAAGVGRR